MLTCATIPILPVLRYDPEKTSHCDRVSLAKIMEDLGRRPDTEEELDDLFRVTDKDGSGLIDFDEFVNMMVVRVGFKATPGNEPTFLLHTSTVW